MIARTSTPCDRCLTAVRRGSPIVLLRGLWLHPACVTRPAMVRPYVGASS